MELLSEHSVLLPLPCMHGLTSDQIKHLKIKDEHVETCTPSGRVLEAPDPVGHRNTKVEQ